MYAFETAVAPQRAQRFYRLGPIHLRECSRTRRLYHRRYIDEPAAFFATFFFFFYDNLYPESEFLTPCKRRNPYLVYGLGFPEITRHAHSESDRADTPIIIIIFDFGRGSSDRFGYHNLPRFRQIGRDNGKNNGRNSL